MRVLIVGAGIGGLSTALSLHAAGIGASVVDSAVMPRSLGAGLHLQSHAVRELTELGLGDALAAAGIQTAEMVHFDRYGNRIWGFATGRNAGYHWPQYSMRHGELRMILLDAVRARLGAGAVRTGIAFESFEESGAEVVATATDRATGTHLSLRADALVGADGLYSGVRAQLHPHEPPPRQGRIKLWRGVTPGAPFLSGRTLAVSGTNAAMKFVAYPISRQAELRGAALINWVAEMIPGENGDRAGDADRSRADWNQAGRIEDVLPWFDGWKFDWLDIPALIKGAEEVLEYPMVDRDPLPFWGRGRVTLLGDAAHPMYPIGANGGSQAVVDSRVLAYSLATAASVPDGLAAYEHERREKANAIVLACRDMPADRMLQMVSVRAPDGFDKITDVLSAAELAAFDDAYRETTLPDVAALNARPPILPPIPLAGCVRLLAWNFWVSRTIRGRFAAPLFPEGPRHGSGNRGGIW